MNSKYLLFVAWSSFGFTSLTIGAGWDCCSLNIFSSSACVKGAEMLLAVEGDIFKENLFALDQDEKKK